MSTALNTSEQTSDQRLLDLLRGQGPLSVLEMAAATDVTSNAVRQRLTRLMDQGLVERQAAPRGRGRPSHKYSLTEKARRQAGSNFADLALVLWDELRSVKDPEVRRGLLARVAKSLAGMYAGRVEGETIQEKMQALSALFAERSIPLEVEAGHSLPVLTVRDCPYPDLAERDRSICAVEKMLFSRLLETDMRLSECRLEGFSCCQFEAAAEPAAPLAAGV